MSIEHSLVVVNPIGTQMGIDRVVSMKIIGDDDTPDWHLRESLRELVEEYTAVCQNEGWEANMIPGDYIWKKRIEVLDQYGRLRCVRDFEVLTYFADDIEES